MIRFVGAALLAIALMMPAASSAQAGEPGEFPWKAGDAPPTVAGVTLGISRAALDSALGPPARVQTLGSGADAPRALSYPALGLSIVFSDLDGVAVIYLLTAEAGAIDEIKVGEDRGRVIGRWGPPSTQEGQSALYIAGKWVVVVRYDGGGHVAQLGLGRMGN